MSTNFAWRQVPGWPDYEVSSCGQVRNAGVGNNRIPGRLLAQQTSATGHKAVQLSRPGEKRRFFVHRLVLMAFVGPCPEGMECCHNNSVPGDNRLENLRWDTRLGNERDKVAAGTSNAGSRHGMSRLTEDQVREIRTSSLGGRAVARLFGVSEQTVCGIRKGYRWRHVV
jgi:HNH endonuclease/NUMOD4 motif-containing protein